MDIKAVRTFHRIVDSGSFIRAAEQLNYAQSTVTMQIQKLESELGVPLFERAHKSVRLTEAGRLFRERSLRIVQDIERLQSSMADTKAGEAGSVRLGAIEPVASHRLPAILERFKRRLPNVRVSIEIANTPTLGDRILRGELDVALSSAPEWTSELYFHPVYAEEFVVLMPESHPLAAKPDIAPADLPGHRLLVTAAGCPYRRKLGTILQETACAEVETMEIGSMTALPYYAAQGLGIALVPRIALQPEPPGTAVRILKHADVDMTVGLLCKASEFPLQAAGAKLYEHLKRELSG
ncbi:LysR family transcriptional regulator [Cohnella sp. CFH 77786]|uniref:LysR family transcriptional regulator n=1 Tax=Cohnella sp. CFH 77786 TaxID=2662265 RepID=UPI001C60DE3C|nr:LysR family transcriptional regulator [Cohnella sp. CFH 77786]MBW5447682.1 LysR family transcriptional regulator [Cohnella sp. CFH 77786]